jgi:hypothetical protein
MDAGRAVLVVETAATLFMSGVLWTMQVLNYPEPPGHHLRHGANGCRNRYPTVRS